MIGEVRGIKWGTFGDYLFFDKIPPNSLHRGLGIRNPRRQGLNLLRLQDVSSRNAFEFKNRKWNFGSNNQIYIGLLYLKMIGKVRGIKRQTFWEYLFFCQNQAQPSAPRVGDLQPSALRVGDPQPSAPRVGPLASPICLFKKFIRIQKIKNAISDRKRLN